MKRKNLYIKIIIIIAFALVAKFFLFNYSYIPEKSDFEVNLDDVRSFCSTDSTLPVQINSIATAEGELIPWTIAAGEKNIPNKTVLTSFQVVYKDRTVIIDAPMNEKQFNDFKYGKEFLKKNFKIQQKAMQEARLILFTDVHVDHMGGIVHFPNPKAIIKNVLLTKKQLNNRKIKKLGLNKKFLHNVEALDYKHCFTIAPGIVLIQSAGHSKGHQMIYVKLQNGNEYLLTGDAVWNFANIERLKNRPFLATLFSGENIKHLGHQIRWLHELHKTEDIFIIPSHDPDVIKDYKAKGLLGTIR